jgi:hypothetical protein
MDCEIPVFQASAGQNVLAKLRSPLTWCLLVLAVSLYTASFFLPAYREAQPGSGRGGPPYRIDPGYTAFVSALIFGWPAWWANPSFWLAVALLLARRKRTAVGFAVLALVLALSTIPLATVYRVRELYRLMAGFWMWLAACATLVLTCCYDRNDARRAKSAFPVTGRSGALGEHKEEPPGNHGQTGLLFDRDLDI